VADAFAEPAALKFEEKGFHTCLSLCKNFFAKRIAKAQPTSWRKLLKAILHDDSRKAARLLADDPTLARGKNQDEDGFVALLTSRMSQSLSSGLRS
jgi:hypothetical protein